jgi:hypothetical protein
MGETDRTGQSNRASIYQRHTPTPAKHAEYGIPFHDAQVAPESKLEPTGYGMTCHRGDDWFVQIHTAGTHGAITIFFHAIGMALSHGLQVSTSTKIATCPSQYPHPCFFIRLKRPEGIGQFLGRLAVHGVSYFGAVNNDGGHGTVSLY